MDIFDVEIIKFWRSLQSNKVKFILAGDFASHLHGHKGFTGMMEIWIKNTQENHENLHIALKEYCNRWTVEIIFPAFFSKLKAIVT